MSNQQTPELSTITEFLQSTGANIRVFDMGRRVARVGIEDFLRFERARIAWPYPFQQSAWIGLLFWDKETEKNDHFIWFVKLPLDEQGYLQQAARDEFLSRVLENVSRKLSDDKGQNDLEDVMKDNPFAFRPKEERMAVFHALAGQVVGEQPSRFYEHAQEYFSGKVGYDQWAFVGFQGIADVACRLDQDDNETMLVEALPKLPPESLGALCSCLENQKIGTAMSEALLARTQALLAEENVNVNLLAALIRGIAGSPAVGLRKQLLSDVLAHDVATEIEVLAAIGSRAWEALHDEELRSAFMERLAVNRHGQEFFNLCMADLLFVPGMREPLLQVLRSPDRSPQLSAAIGAMFQQYGA